MNEIENIALNDIGKTALVAEVKRNADRCKADTSKDKERKDSWG